MVGSQAMMVGPSPQHGPWSWRFLVMLSSSAHQNPAESKLPLEQSSSLGVLESTQRESPEPIWPDHYPSGCPGDRGSETNGTVFQFVRSKTPTDLDILSAMEKGTHKNKCQCLRASLSCYITFDFIKEIHDSGGLFSDWLIASCNLNPEMGRILQTGKPEHHSLWLKKASLPVYLANLEVQE